MNNTGWIKIHRDIIDHWVFEDPVKLRCWVDILFTVNYEDKKTNIGLKLFECKRGQSLLSISSWAKRWNMSKNAARNVLNLLRDDKMITVESVGISTRLTVCNYDDYQQSTHDWRSTGDRLEIDRGTQLKKDKKERKKEIYINKVPNEDEVRQYFLENGYEPSIGEKAFKYYNTAGWQDSRGNKVKNWKQKMQAVWFKEENKIIEKQKTTMVY